MQHQFQQIIQEKIWLAAGFKLAERFRTDQDFNFSYLSNIFFTFSQRQRKMSILKSHTRGRERLGKVVVDVGELGDSPGQAPFGKG